MSTLRFTTVIAVAASTLLATPAIATPGSGFAPSPIVSGNFGTLNVNTADDKTGKWGLHLKTLDSTDIGADRLTVQAGGFSGWHAHPAPVFVTVVQGTIVWYDGSNPLCTGNTYSAGQSFVEGAYVPHNVWSADGAQFIAVVIKPAGFPGPAFRLDRPKPNNCNF
ncbi:cupin domain-containing protein [Sphingomonas sp. SM33]|uniref:Cupin domain-containing protein n=1 Tax=Sphingomonas telluris TaxID=2907998 RepID=A0ABS9VI64_9SPHN|nr:cupin domain-containing protein [Sphingomonas telluris]MCH8614661.1 cupin domain-containing protein [Sphingomonas telluris]